MLKILTKSEAKELSKKVQNLTFQMVDYGYRWSRTDKTMASFIAPLSFMSGLARNLNLNSNKDLRSFLMQHFNTEEVLEQKFEYTMQLMGFEFEKTKFLVWFNATGKGCSVESNCKDPGIYHRFVLTLLRNLNYQVEEDLIKYIPKSYRSQLNPDRTLPIDYLNDLVVSKEEFLKKVPYLK